MNADFIPKSSLQFSSQASSRNRNILAMCACDRQQPRNNNSRADKSRDYSGLTQRDAKQMSYAYAHLDRKCKNCEMKFKQYVSFSKEAEKITIKVYRYKCPFCDALVRKPTLEEIRKALILKETQREE